MANNETRILKTNTFEDWRQKDNEISLELGDVDQLDSRILDKTFTYTASADDSIFTGNDSTGKALRFEQKPDEVLDLLNIVIFTGLSSIPSNFIVGNVVTQSGGFSGKIVWINKNKVALSNTSGTFNAGQNLVQGSQNIPHANLVRLISESVKVGLAKVKVQGTEITQGNVQAGYHVPNFVLKVTCTGSFTVPAEFTEGAILTQANGFQGTLLSASTSVLRFKVTSGSFSVSQLVQLQGDSSKRILAANLSALEVQDETFENIIELHTLAGASHSVHVISNSSVDAINEVQDDVGDITSLGTNNKADVVTAVNELETGIRGSSSDLVADGLTTSANDLVAAINEHDAELGTITAGAMGTSASTVSTAIAELEQEIDVLNTRVEPTQAFDSRFSSSTVMDGLNELQGDIGTVANLTTTADGNLVVAINELDLKQGSATLGTAATTLSGAVNELETAIRGTANNYTLTTAANDLVAAVNEHESDLGTMSLDTSASNITAAINELHGEINSNDTDIAARLIKSSSSSQALATDLTLGGNKTYTVQSGSTLAIASGATLSIAGSSSGVSTFGTSFLEVDGNQTSTPMGLQISRDHISGAPTPYPAIQWREGSVSSKPERAWQIVGLNDAGTSSQEADIVTFFNAKDLIANNDEAGISVTWDSTNQNFDFDVRNTVLTFTSSTFRSSGNLGQATITDLGDTTFALTANKLDLGNNEKVLLGNSDELQIYYDGTNSYIKESGGELRVDASLIRFRNAAGDENLATFDQNGAVALYFDNDSKFATTNVGVAITGDAIVSDYLQAEGIRAGSTGTDPGDGNLAVNNNATISGNLTVTGNMTVNGTQTILNTDTLTVEDTLVLAGNALTSEPSTGGFGIETGPIITQTVNGAVSSSTSVTLDSGTGVLVGQGVYGTGVASGATVSAISGTTLTLSAASSIADGATLTFSHPTKASNVTGSHSIVYNYATDQWEADGSLILSNATNTPPTIEGNNFGANKNLDFNAGSGISIATTTSGNDIDVQITNTLDGYSGWFLSVQGTDEGNIADDERVDFQGGTLITAVHTEPGSGVQNRVTFNHDNVSRSNTSATDDGTYVKGITTNAQGHITAVDSGDFDDYYYKQTEFTSANTASKPVIRDASGNFSANTITASLTGTASNAQLLDNLDSTAFLRSNAADSLTDILTIGTGGRIDMDVQDAIVAGNHGHGVYGLYNANKFQHVWGMGVAYDMDAGGNNLTGYYGLAYTHSNNSTDDASGRSANDSETWGGGHQLLNVQNGSVTFAAGSHIWTSGQVYTTSYGKSSQWKSAYDDTNTATNANTASKIVKRDSSGNFSAGTITASLSGNASSATTLQTARTIGGVSFNGSANINLPGVNTAGNQNTSGNAATATKATKVTVTNRTTENTDYYIAGVAPTIGASSGNNLQASTDFYWNTGTNKLYAPEVVATTFSGNATSATTAGSITNQANSATITASTANTANQIVQRDGNGDIQVRLLRSNYSSTQAFGANAYIMGQQNTSSDNYVRPFTAAQVRTFLNVADGANAYTLPSAISGHTSGNTASRVVSRDGSGGFSMGALTCTSVTSSGDVIAYSSDDRLKDRIGPVENALDKVSSLQGFYYKWNETAQELGFNDEDQVGLSAQDVEEIMPEVVKSAPINEEHGTDYKTIQYEKLVPLLVESIKELKAEIDELKKGKS